MSRDGRGTPGRTPLKDHEPKLKLSDLLRRRRTNLTAFVAELGVTTHVGLAIWCRRMGVVAPSPQDFETAFPPASKVNSPQEGIVVLEAPPVIDSETGSPIDPDGPIEPGLEFVTDAEQPSFELYEGPCDAPQKKTRKKKDSPTSTT